MDGEASARTEDSAAAADSGAECGDGSRGGSCGSRRWPVRWCRKAAHRRAEFNA
jgi:hypothetical protein